MLIGLKSAGVTLSAFFGIKTVRLSNSSGANPPVARMMLKKRAFTLAGTALHCFAVIPSMPGAEFDGILTARASSYVTTCQMY